MLERFTEQAINTVAESQEYAIELGSSSVGLEHLLYAIVKEAKGISLRLFKNANITLEKIDDEVRLCVSQSTNRFSAIPFNTHYKETLKKTMDLANISGHQNILYEHLFLALLSDKTSNVSRILESFEFDIFKAKDILSKLVQKKQKKLEHPEGEEKERKNLVDYIFDNSGVSPIFDRAIAKLSTSEYEILGTEQIIASILEDKDSNLAKIFEQFGVTAESFDEKLKSLTSRNAEYDRNVVFTPKAFIAMNMALQTAKELGSSKVLPEHLALGILKSHNGVAYEILDKLNVNEDDLIDAIVRPIEKQMPETLVILKLAKEEARRIGKKVVGTEMLLLGIISEGAGVGARVLNKLEITLQDARKIIESKLGYGDDYFDSEIVFTKRAKAVLERAWELAKSKNKERIASEDLLMAIIADPSTLAMKVLEQLGVDAVEIKYGILKEIE